MIGLLPQRNRDILAETPRLGASVRRKLSVLLLCDDRRCHANTVLDHIAAIATFSNHDVRIFNPLGVARSRYLDLDEFDAVVVHYSLVIISDHYLSPDMREKIRRFRGLKIQFIQDEYRWVDEVTAMIRYLGIHVLLTLVPPSEVRKIYSEDRLPGVAVLPTRAGYVPEHLVGLQVPPLTARSIDIGYRGRTLPYWLGELAQEKIWIGQGVLARAGRYGLRCDIKWAEEDRIYGQRWNHFLMSCKATLGTESGASITDFDGSIERRTKAYLADNPKADFFEVHRVVLAPYEGNARVTAVSPRIFEAAALKTAMILFPGEYSGVVQPWVHYIPLAKDFSNISEVVARIRDLSFLRDMTERTYKDLVASGRYSQRAFAREFDQLVAEWGEPRGRWIKVGYYLSRLERLAAVARYRIRVCLRPLLKVPMDCLKGAVALGLLFRSCAGRTMLRVAITSVGFLKVQMIRDLLKDVLKLAVLGQARTGRSLSLPKFWVSVTIDSAKGHVLFKSRAGGLLETNDERERLWTTMDEAVSNGRVQTLVWNHTEIGGLVRYRLYGPLCIPVYEGDDDLHIFEGFAKILKRAPGPAKEVLCSLLGREEDRL
jgi:hypothetical protein